MDKNENEGWTIEKYLERMNVWYRTNNIIHEKSELYYNFISSLLVLIDQTYLGPDVISTKKDMVNHFTWCFNRIRSNFIHERIIFLPASTTSYGYLWYFIYKGYYSIDTDNKFNTLLEYFKYLFNYNMFKTDAELESFVDFYKIFDQNLKKTN
jgi:hypothetical protein